MLAALLLPLLTHSELQLRPGISTATLFQVLPKPSAVREIRGFDEILWRFGRSTLTTKHNIVVGWSNRGELNNFLPDVVNQLSQLQHAQPGISRTDLLALTGWPQEFTTLSPVAEQWNYNTLSFAMIRHSMVTSLTHASSIDPLLPNKELS